MRITKPIITIIFFIMVLTSCQKKDKLIGTWERHGDYFSGMKVNVVQEGESFKAYIVFATDTTKLGGFEEGDVKWKNIKKTTENKYEIEDLAKAQIIFNDKFEPSYGLANLELISENEIYIRMFSKGLEKIGTEQKWKRIIEK